VLFFSVFFFYYTTGLMANDSQKGRNFLGLTINDWDITGNRGPQDFKRLRVLTIRLRAYIERPSNFFWCFRDPAVINAIGFGRMVADLKPAYPFDNYTRRLL
jgi:hypothetical protein